MNRALHVVRLSIALALMIGVCVAQNPTGITSCTSKVPRQTCDEISGQMEFTKAFPIMRSVDFVIADPDSFAQIKEGAIDIVLADVIKETHKIPMRHSPFDEHIVFEVTRAAQLRCPDRVVISTDIFRPSSFAVTPGKEAPSKSHQSGREKDFDYGLVQPYLMFIHGYVEGCWSRAGQ